MTMTFHELLEFLEVHNTPVPKDSPLVNRDLYKTDLGSDDFVSSVDPADVRSVWNMMHEVRARYPDGQQQCALGASMFESVCSHGANTMAVWYRTSMLQLLCGPFGQLVDWVHNNEPVEAVFKVAANFPMQKMQIGVVREGVPFDLREFINQIEQIAQA
jgi:hypothetical protein